MFYKKDWLWSRAQGYQIFNGLILGLFLVGSFHSLRAQVLTENSFVELAKIVNPGVVNISTEVLPKHFRSYRDPFWEML
ncbi:MAG: hypothetical protein NZ480_03065, partial [Bdellovibrionaceae bacterium]|nr:hypothetical protein [Pseudobdellovibrionaceae bacterium]MDW8190862.1 hypothetical protein [Pseudobdellovibrionaceae bacterium]